MNDLAASPREALPLRRGLRLEYLTIGWNLVEAFVAVGFGIAAGSIALVGFGFDSLIEVFAATVVVWELRRVGEERERLALRLIAISFFVLAGYVLVESVRDLVIQAEPHESVPGPGPCDALADRDADACSGEAKDRASDEQPNARGRCRRDAALRGVSLILLVGLLLNAAVGWWWADPLAAIGIAILALREGVEAWRDEELR